MEFKKIRSTLYVAQGNESKFTLKKSRGMWWGTCENNTTTFRFPPKKQLKEAMKICKENYYWEWGDYAENN